METCNNGHGGVLITIVTKELEPHLSACPLLSCPNGIYVRDTGEVVIRVGAMAYSPSADRIYTINQFADMLVYPATHIHVKYRK